MRSPILRFRRAARLRPARIVAVGFSIGSGVAACLAAHRPLDGADPGHPVRFASPRSPPAIIRWLPVRLLFRHEMEPAEALRGSRTPVAIIAGGRDTLIPAARTEALRRAVANLVFDRTIAGAGHNDIYRHEAFRTAMREALAAMPAR